MDKKLQNNHKSIVFVTKILHLLIFSSLLAAIYLFIDYRRENRMLSDILSETLSEVPEDCGTDLIAKTIYDWTVANVNKRKHDNKANFGLRMTPGQTYEKGGLCSDYARLYISLCRLGGVEASRLYLYRNPELLDKNTNPSFHVITFLKSENGSLICPDPFEGDLYFLEDERIIRSDSLSSPTAWKGFYPGKYSGAFASGVNWLKIPVILPVIHQLMTALGAQELEKIPTPYFTERPNLFGAVILFIISIFTLFPVMLIKIKKPAPATSENGKIKVLFIMPLPPYTQNGRFRVHQYLPYLDKNNIEYTISPFVSPEFEKIIYTHGNIPKKIFYFFTAIKNRCVDVIHAARSDVVFILRDACPYGPPVFEYLFKLVNRNLVYDLDDAIWMKQPSIYNKYTNFFKMPGKIKRIMAISKVVVCDISYIEDYARQYTDRTVILRCPIDDELYQPSLKVKTGADTVVIGWIGSHSTQVHPKSLTSVYKKLAAKYDNLVFKFVDAYDYNVEGVDIELKPFSKEEEISDLQSFDIGIYPLIDIPYVYGKCGFKTRQYLAVGLPTVNTPLGGIRSFVEDGSNGFIAENEEDWVDKLSLLIENTELRKKIGDAGRRTVVEKLSVRANAGKFIAIIRYAASNQPFSSLVQEMDRDDATVLKVEESTVS